ncbi:MAG: NAD-dependent epimerase/dehydratase family protein [Gammaproteobacteria bacterium]|nr:NAD-dependent epimerase/dehydratase family protein [Gammaproteobacteria bacterium]
MSKHIILGGTGFIGSHVAEALVQAGKQLTALVRPESDVSFLKRLGVSIKAIDNFNQEALQQSFNGFDIVYNCTANVHPHQSLAQYRQTQVELAETIARATAAANCKRLVQLSSVEVYGDFGIRPMNEDYPKRPLFDFQQSLLDREKRLQEVASETGLDIVMLRPAGTYGRRSVVLDLFMKSHKKGEFPMIGEGSKKSSAVDTRDIGRAMVFLGDCVEAKGQVYNLQGYRLSMKGLKLGLDRVTGRETKAQKLPVGLAKVLANILVKFTPYGKVPMITPFIVHVANSSLLINDDKIRALGFETKYGFEDTLDYIVSEESTPLESVSVVMG